MEMIRGWYSIRVGIACLLLLCAEFASPAVGQGANPFASRLTLQGPAEQSQSPVVRDGLGRPCIDLEAAARAHVSNPNFVDHVISIKNSCPRTIDVRVCYFGSDTCISANVQPYKRIDKILGFGTTTRFFRYSVTQK